MASWYGGKRALQNAADSAAIAAATNGTSDGYDDEARAVAAQYGLKNGQDGVTVTAANNAACPAGGNDCYSVTISRIQPLLLAQVVGFSGDAHEADGAPAKLILAKAVATKTNQPRDYCVVALAGSGTQQGIRTNGAPKSDLSGCSVMSNTDAVCNGHDLNADFGDAHGTSNGCGKQQTSHVDPITDQYSGLRSNIPSNNCSSYPTAPKNHNDPALPPSNLLSGMKTGSVIEMCGDVQLSGPTFINSGGNTVLIVRDGSLDLNGYTLQTQPGTSLTIVFTGSNSSRVHAPIGDGMLDFSAPTSGAWKGMAMYQDPNTSGGLNITEAGNSPAWKITGMVYLPHSSVTMSGVINKASSGKSCFALVADNVTFNGTGEILAHGQCKDAGLDLPHSLVPSRGELVS